MTPTELQESFQQCMREVDALIKQGHFDEARTRLGDARKLNPSSPYILAFEERIKIFEKRLKEGKHPAPPGPAGKEQPAATSVAAAAAAAPAHKAEIGTMSREIGEKKLRDQLEAEYRQRFAEELKNAESAASKAVEQERLKFEKLQATLKAQHEAKVAEVHKQLEAGYQKKLDDELRTAEERLRQQFDKEQSFFEGEIKARLVEHYEGQRRELEDKVKKEQSDLLEKERAAFVHKENGMKEEMNKKLLESLRKSESVFREQSAQQQQVSQQKIREDLQSEFDKKLAKERAKFDQQSTDLEQKAKSSFEAERKKLDDDYQRQVREQVEQIKKREAQEFEKKRQQLAHDLESEHQQRYQAQMESERTKIQSEADAALEAERSKLRDEREAMLSAENEKLQKIRVELRTEMDENLLRRLEQMTSEYDRKMELLGFSIPHNKDDCLALYQQKVRGAYEGGEPSVDDARKLMELKELLELTYDDHVKVETDVRMELYLQSVQKGIISGKLQAKDLGKLESLKQKFHITPEEASQMEPYILSKIQQLTVKGRILIVDDEAMILDSLRESLEDGGYQVVACSKVKEALEKLKTESVDIIVSDISFPPGEPDGFKFFKAVQEQPPLRKIPFIFLSALNDEVFVRTGVQLGIDDYLTKPIDMDLLLAVIEGKLKRVRSTMEQK